MLWSPGAAGKKLPLPASPRNWEPDKNSFERDLAEVAELNVTGLAPVPLRKEVLKLARRPGLCLLDLDLMELTALIKETGQPAFRAKQVWNWLYQQFALDYGEMTNL